MPPLPQPTRRRTNPPTIPTTNLPAAGREGPAPRCPYALGATGKRWWKWAWALPQAAAWDAGSLYAIARRGQLEDDQAALASIEGLDWTELRETETGQECRAILGALAAIAGGKMSLVKEMRELDDRLGLTPKGRAALRWSIVAPVAPVENSDEVAQRREDRKARIAAG